ncbi:phosphatase PAP2 family protein [Actinomadura soli]|uniref:Phosphatase PAP2 family protein n=1 Tax=Actinomadura soli TaxID=2508997 RepID=A0A5C4JCY9_9ACTN|nr:phosphatase PAP2 family protein [Actinomadura soli]TMR01693.1 phosphatase PAP2 family protein [Actinomadura soli]
MAGLIAVCALGLVLSFAVGYVWTSRPPGSGTTAAVRLRTAREQLDRTLGPAGSFVVFLGAGTFLVTAVCLPLGELSQRLLKAHDVPMFDLVQRTMRPGAWTDAMEFLTQSGNVWQTRYAGLAGAVVLTLVAVRTRRRPWVPALLIGTIILVERFQQSALAALVDRGHPPTTLGTYPSGGCARLISIYGVIVLIALSYLRAGPRARAVVWGAFAAFAFWEGYTRWYLSKHWVTDVYGGWIYGYLLLAVAVFAGRSLLAEPGEREPSADSGADGGHEPVRAASGG